MVIDELLEFAKGTMGGAMMAKKEEAMALGATSGLVGDDIAILNLTVVIECGVDAIRDGFPVKVMDEELLLGRVKVSKAVNLSEGI